MKNNIHDCPELMEAIEQLGFLPLLAGSIPGFSADEMIVPECRYQLQDDGSWEWPLWQWKGPIVTEGHFAYGKFFDGKAGFVTMAGPVQLPSQPSSSARRGKRRGCHLGSATGERQHDYP